MRLRAGQGPVFRNAQLADVGLSAVHDKQSVFVSGVSYTDSLRNDANIRSYTGATYYQGGRVVVDGSSNFKFAVRTPSIGGILANGTIQRVSPGLMDVHVQAGRLAMPLILDLANKSDAAQPVQCLSVVEGSLSSHLSDQIDSRINSGMTMGANGLLYTSQNHNAATYIRNPNLWCSDVDISCISPWNSYGGNTRAGTLVTPRNFLNAAHYEVNTGNQIRFVDMNGNVHTRAIVGKKRHPSYDSYSHYPDLTIYTLDSDLPDIIPCMVMPSDYRDYLVENALTRPAAFGLDQEEKALVIDFYGGVTGSNWGGAFNVPTDSVRLIFNEDKIGGDSGNPAFIILNGELVLVTVWTMGGAGQGTAIARFIDDINQMIVDSDTQAGFSGPVSNPAWPNTGGHYQLKAADFSAFPNYN